MVAPNIEVVGAKELRRAINRTKDKDLKAELKKANREAAEIVAYEAQTIVPVAKTGNLLESIRASGTQTSGVVRAGRASVQYAGVVHFGWPARNRQPNTFLYDAADSRVDEVVRQYEAAIQAVADQLHRTQGAS